MRPYILTSQRPLIWLIVLSSLESSTCLTFGISSSIKKIWFISFLTGRSQITRIVDGFSIVVGFRNRFSLYILMESDLHPISKNNRISKFADDSNLIVFEQCEVTIQEEMANVLDCWARLNKMVVNFSKTNEIVFHRPHPSDFSLLPTFDNI